MSQPTWSSFTGAADARTRLQQASHMPEGDARIEQLERLEQEAVGLGDERLLAEVRLELVHAYDWGGHPLRMLAPAGWLARRLQERAPWLDDAMSYRILWRLKWVANELPRTPDVSRQQVEQFLATMRDLYVGAGEQLQPVLLAEYGVGSMLDGARAATPVHDQWRAAPRTHLSDCEACEAAQEVKRLVELDDPAGAVQAGRDLLSGQLRCAEQPQHAQASLMLPLLQLGAVDQAGAAARAAWPLLRNDPAAVGGATDLVRGLARTGNLDWAIEVFTFKRSQLDDPTTPWAQLWFLGAGARLCTSLMDAGRPGQPLPAAGERWLPASELGPELTAQARDLAARFDARNGNDHVSRRLERQLSEPDMAHVDLSGVPGSQPGRQWLQFPSTGLWALAPSDADIARMDAAQVAAVAEDARRFGSSTQQRRLAERWLEVNWQGLDPSVVARTCQWLVNPLTTWAQMERLLRQAEESWQAAGEQQHAHAVAVERLALAGDQEAASALELVVRERGDDADQLRALNSLAVSAQDDQAVMARLAELAHRARGATADERFQRAHGLLMSSALAGQQVGVEQLGLLDGEFEMVAATARMVSTTQQVAHITSADQAREAAAELVGVVQFAHRVGAPSPWAQALIQLGDLYARLGEFDEAEQCLRAASAPAVQTFDVDLACAAALPLTQVLRDTQRLVEAAETISRAVALSVQPAETPAQQPGRDAIRLDVLTLASEVDLDLGNAEHSAILAREAINLAERLGVTGSLPQLQHQLGMAHLEAGDSLAARPALARAVELGRALGRPEVFDWLCDLARATHQTDGLDAGLAVLDAARVELRERPVDDIVPELAELSLRARRAQLCAMSGELQRGRDELAGLAEALRAAGQPGAALWQEVFDARLELDLADETRAGAGDRLLQLGRVARDSGDRNLAAVALEHLAEWHWQAGREDAANAVVAELG